MHIDAIEVFHVALPLRQPLSTPWGQQKNLQTVLVRMRSGEAVGWGESGPGNAPLAAAEWAAGAFLCVRDWLAPRLVGTSIDSGQELQQQLAPVRGNAFAKAALDAAWWDLHARLQDKPLHALLAPARDAIDVGTSFDRMESIDHLLEAIGKALEAGFARIELKFRPGWETPMINAVRHTFPTTRFHIDIEGTMRLDHMEMFCRLDDFNLAMIEQPLPPDDLVGHAMVQETIRTPLCLDESITTPEQAEMALELHSARYINVKPDRVGGLTHAIAIHDACQEASVGCWVGLMPQSAIGTRIAMALAAKANFTYPADSFLSDQLLETDLAPPPPLVRTTSDGLLRIPLWEEPGIGVVPDPDRLEKLCASRAKIP
jgi:O-succinylbenzoate synthase